MFYKVILAHVKLLRFAILPGILGGIAGFIGPHHSASLKTLIGVVIGIAIQHRYMDKAIKNVIKDYEELLDRFLKDKD